MHKLYLNYGKYDFYQQITQIIYSTVLSQLIEVFLCFLSLTDKYIYQIKKLLKSKNSDDKNSIFNIFLCIKIKLGFFFVFTFIFFLTYWYIVTSFCSVYQNTQITFIKDCVFSYIINLLYPFAIYLFTSSLRKCAIKDKKGRLCCLYKLSEIIPFF